MRRNAKASTAGSTQRQATGLGRIFRGALATRASSLPNGGSGAPAHRGRLALLTVAVLVFAALLIATSAMASKEAIIYFGNVSGFGGLGGEFRAAHGVAVNNSGNGPADQGDIYVTDNNNYRVQRFDSAGNFISAWGADVALPDGGTDYEICTVAADCQRAAATGGNGTMAGNGALDNPRSVAVDDDTGNVYVGDRDNRRVNAYDGAGNFLFSVGRDVADPNGATTVEICDGATDVCRRGDTGSGAGEFGSVGYTNVFAIAVSPPDGNPATGSIFVADTGNRRVNTYDLDGANPASFGSAAVFRSGHPRRGIAVDSRGIVYIDNSKFVSHFDRSQPVERYDSANANGGGVGFLDPIPGSFDEAQEVTFSGAWKGGLEADKFTLSCPDGSVTSPTDWTAPGFIAARVRVALEASCGTTFFVIRTSSTPPGAVGVVFRGTNQATDVPTMTCTTVAGPGSCSITREADGFTATLPSGDTESLAVDPDSDGAGPDTDVLYLARDPNSPGPTLVHQFGPTNDPGLTVAPSAADDTHGAGVGFSSVFGLGVNYTSDRLFASAGNRVYTLADVGSLAAPGLALDEVTVKTDSTATFSATVDPKGALADCTFQYSTDQNNWTDVPAIGCATLAPGGGAQPISEDVTGLDPNTRYFVRLEASRPFIPGLTTTSGVKVFNTDSVPPVITDVGAVQVADTSARMVGTVDPRNSATGYVFQYGLTPALGSVTAPLNIGGGTTPITVSQVIGGLSPDTTYYFRLVATNLTGTTASASKTLHTRTDPPPPALAGNCANEAIRQAQGTAHLPACRAYEMVSPPDKNQGELKMGGWENGIAFSGDGQGAAFCTSALFGEPPAQQDFICGAYISKRGAAGWTTTAAAPPHCRANTDGTFGGVNMVLSPESYERAAVEITESAFCSIAPLDPAAPLGQFNLYRQDRTTDPLSYDLLAPNPSPLAFGSSKASGGSEDFSHIVYITKGNQTDPPDSPAPGDFYKIYDWEEEGNGGCATPGGCLSLVSKDPSGTPFTTHSTIPGDPDSSSTHYYYNSMSRDGERIYFLNPARREGSAGTCFDAGCEIYLRENATTTHVSASECTTDCGVDSTPDDFLWTNPAGDKTFFNSCAKLTDASSDAAACSRGRLVNVITHSNSKLYRWDRDGAPGHQLVDLTVDNEPADGSQPGALDLIGASDDGDTVFFVAKQQIVSGEPAPPGNSLKLYRWRWNAGSPSVDYLAPYVPAMASGRVFSEGRLLRGEPNSNRRHVRVTPDGKYLLIQTLLALDPAADRDSDADVYRWEEARGWLCVSCQLPGAPSAGHANGTEPVLPSNAFFHRIVSLSPEHTISDDGQRVFFSTPDALVPEDVNGEAGCSPPGFGRSVSYPCADVYEWHDGTVSLISSGTGTEGTVLMGATRTGNEVFFFTRDRLVGWDIDNGRDIYVAHTGGGFPEPPAVPPVCEGEACRGPATVAPATSGAGSAVFEGPGNQAQPKRRDCGLTARRAHKLSAAAKDLRRRAKRAGSAKQARQLRRRAARSAKRGRALSKSARRCRRANRRAGK